MSFGQRLQDLRQRAGMSQDALAERLEVSRQAVSRWERDETMPETEKVIDLAEKGMSKGELESVRRAVGGIDALVDPKAKDQDTVALLAYLSPDQKFDKLLENQHVLAEPVVRNGKQATVGYAPDVWKTWE